MFLRAVGVLDNDFPACDPIDGMEHSEATARSQKRSQRFGEHVEDKLPLGVPCNACLVSQSLVGISRRAAPSIRYRERAFALIDAALGDSGL